MDMSIFQIESNKMKPQAGSILISAPFLRDYHFARSVVLLVEHNEEGSMGIVLNKKFNYQINLDELVPELEFKPKIPVYKGGPVSRDILFYLHTLHDLEGAVSLGNGLYLNGNFDQLKQYILDGNPVEGVIRFFTGYAGWDAGQLEKEIEENNWLVATTEDHDLLNPYLNDYWKLSLYKMGGKYAIWSRYPQFPTLN